MPVTRAQVIAEARAWLGTPYQHQGRIKGVSCDCIGLLVGVAHALELSDADFLDYGKRPDGRLREALEAHLIPVQTAKAQAGDVLLFAWNAVPMHVALASENDQLIHAYLPNRKVVESGIDSRMRAALMAAYQIPGVE